MADENEHVAIGGQADAISTQLSGVHTADRPLPAVFALGVRALSPADGVPIPVTSIEAAVLDRTTGSHRTFRRLDDTAMAELLALAAGTDAPGTDAQPGSTQPPAEDAQ